MKRLTFLKFFGDRFNTLLNSIGWGATFYYKGKKNAMYEIVTTPPTYAPWNIDKDFQEIFNTVKNYSYVDIYRCYELWQLISEIKNISGALIEIGVWRGGTGAIIGKKAELCGINDTIYLCDTFEGMVKADASKDSSYKNGAHSDTSVEIVEKLVFDKVKLKNVKILKGIFPEESKHLIKDKKFRFCHIDVDVYYSAKDIIDWIWDKISVGGIIVYDDYGCKECDGIRKFVEEQRKNSDRLIIHNLNGHAVVVKLS